MSPEPGSFPLAPMSTAILVITAVLLLLPVGFGVGWALGAWPLGPAGALVAALYVVVWLAARPTRFEVGGGALRVVFPLWIREIPAADVKSAEVVPLATLRPELGRAIRIGVGGLWGVFGWLWTAKRGLVETYVSRTDGLVLVERRTGRTLLLTPTDPPAFVSALRRSSATG